MHPVLFYLAAAATLSVTSGIGLFLINQAYSRQNMYPDPEKPLNDGRNYKIFTLPNQIHMMLITSNTTELSAISIKSETGFMIDPPLFQGMCNYIQNLLITSSKYPQEDILRKFIWFNSGKELKACSEHESQFYYEVPNSAFFGILDLTASLFVSPYITKQQMDRTLQSMHLKWKNKEGIEFLIQLAARQQHPLRYFYSGNLQTLFEIPEQNELNPYIEAIKFFRAKYSANRLSVVIYTNEELKKRVTELIFEYFSDVVDKQLKTPTYRSYGMPLKNQRFFFVQSPFKELHLFFDFDAEHNFQTKSVQFVVDMIFGKMQFCDEQVAKKRAYSCKPILKELPKEFAILEIVLELPPQATVAEILKDFYACITQLKNMQDLEQHFAQMRQLQLLNFNYGEMELQKINQYSSVLKTYFSKDILLADIYKKYDEQSVKHVLDEFNPINMTVMYLDHFFNPSEETTAQPLKASFLTIHQDKHPHLHSQLKPRKVYLGSIKKRVQKFPDIAGLEDIYSEESISEEEENDEPASLDQILSEEEQFEEQDEIEQVIVTDYDFEIAKPIVAPKQELFTSHPLFGLAYFEAGIQQGTIKELLSSKGDVKLSPQLSLPENFDLVETPIELQQKSKKKQNFKYPDLLSTSTAGNLWYIHDTTNNLPKVVARILIRFVDFENNDENMVAISLLRLNFRPQLSVPGKVNVTQLDSQIEFHLVCFSAQIDQALQEVTKGIEEAYKLKDDFDWKMDTIRLQQKKTSSTTQKQVILILKQILSHSPKLKEGKYEKGSIQSRLDKLKVKQRWEVLLYGNIGSEHAKEIYEKVLPKAQQGSKEFYQEEVLKLSKRPITFRQAVLSSKSVVTLNLYQGSENSLVQFVYFRILHKLMKIQIHEYLFTQLQLGFIVDIQLLMLNHIESIGIMVQSSTYDPEEIDFYIEESLGYFETFLNRLSDRDFQTLKASLQTNFQQTPNTIEQRAEVIWTQISNGYYYFTQRECMIIALDKIQKSELIKFFLIHFKARNSKLSLQLYKTGQQIPKEILREQDTYAHKMSELVTSSEQLQGLIKETYKFKPKYITEAPLRVC